MTAWQSNKRGTLMLKRTFPGVGKIQRASGTKDPRTLTGLNEMLTSLYNAGRLDVLELIRDGNVKPLEVWKHYRLGDWSHLPTVHHVAPLADALKGWIATHDCGEDHRKSLRMSRDYLLSVADSHATVSDLPDVVRALRADQAEMPNTFNKARSCARTFLESTIGKYSALWTDVSGVPPIAKVSKRRRHPKRPKEALAIRSQLLPNAADMWWTLCTSGMRVRSEYIAGNWRVDGQGLVITSAKKGGQVERLVPLIWRPVKPGLTYWGFRQALRRLPEELAAHDARRTYTTLLVEAGVPRVRRILYLGHGPQTVTDLYEWSEVKKYLAEDAARVRKLIGTDERALRLME